MFGTGAIVGSTLSCEIRIPKITKIEGPLRIFGYECNSEARNDVSPSNS